MLLLDADNAAPYLRQQGWISAAEPVSLTRLAGGVSNEVVYVARAQPELSFVLKQARPQLRTPDPWFCGVERIWREVEVLRICSDLLDRAADANLAACTPRILFEDRNNFAFAMTAAPREHVVWKQLLLAGYQGEALARASGVGFQTAVTQLVDRQPGSLSHGTLPPGMSDAQIAQQCGRLLGTLHAAAWGNAEIQSRLADRQIFDQLRLDPYYRTVARAHPGIAPHLQRLIASLGDHPLSLVHADFSPKNLLVYPGGLMMVDFETGHFGDPAFDLGFFLSHLVLKAFYHAPQQEPLLELTRHFWSTYEAVISPVAGRLEYSQLAARGIQNFAGCAWARIDGKSKVEYLGDPLRQAAVCDLSHWVLSEQPGTWDDVLDGIRERCVKVPLAAE